MVKKEKAIQHYSILFSMYVGMELQKNESLRTQILGDDPKRIEAFVSECAKAFMEQDALDDSAEFFDAKFREYVHANYPSEDQYV